MDSIKIRADNKMIAIRTNILNPISEDIATYFKDAVIIISESGMISHIITRGEYDENPDNYNDTFDYSDCVAIPGLIDMHAHLPQFSAVGIGRGELLHWLADYIFPLEKKFGNNEYTYRKSRKFFDFALSMGTTTIVTYCSTSAEATEIAFKTASDSGIRAFIGQSLIDLPNDFGYYSDFDKIKSDLDKLISLYHNSNYGKLQYIVTPRYAGSCSSKLLKYAGNIAKQNNLFIQSHLAENRAELELIRNLHSDYKNYTRVYSENGLMHEKSIYAHCIYLSKDEIEIIRNSGAVVCHCPSSNRYLSSGIMPLNEYSSLGIRLALGTDVGAGYSLSMLNEAKEAIETSNTYNILNQIEYSPFSETKSFYIATKGAAEILYPGQKIGVIEKDYLADISIFKIDELAELAEPRDVIRKLLYTQFNRTAELVLINGKIEYGGIKSR